MSDVLVKVIDREGVEKEIPCPTDIGYNMMEAIHTNEVCDEGSIGVCGGIGMCASCQCYVTDPDGVLPPKNETEDAMLLEASNVKENSRLACQIPVTHALATVTFELAPED